MKSNKQINKHIMDIVIDTTVFLLSSVLAPGSCRSSRWGSSVSASRWALFERTPEPAAGAREAGEVPKVSEKMGEKTFHWARFMTGKM